MIAIQKTNRDLNPGELIGSSKIDGPLGMLKIVILPEQIDIIAGAGLFAIYAWFKILPRLRAGREPYSLIPPSTA